VLDSTGSLPLSKLSKKVALSPSMITSIVDQLENKELVVRNRKTSDRRVILIELTDKGKGVVNAAPPSFQEQLVNSLGYLHEDEKNSIHENLSKLLSIVVSEVLIDSALLGIENTLVEVAPSVLKTEDNK
jgi:DNA-binding MarR family transcriptional regulator